MPTYKKNVHLGTKDPLWGKDDIANGSITREKIADGAVTFRKLGDDVKRLFAEFADRFEALENGTVKHEDTIMWIQGTECNVGDDITLNATALSGLPVMFTDSNGEEITKLPTDIANEALVITASTTGNVIYRPASATKTFVIKKVDDAITWNLPETIHVGDNFPLLNAVESESGLPVTCFNLQGNIIYAVPTATEGTVTIIAKTEGNDTYNAATSTKQVEVKIQEVRPPILTEEIFYGASDSLPSSLGSAESVELAKGEQTTITSISGKNKFWVAVPTGCEILSWTNTLDSTEDLITLNDGSELETSTDIPNYTIRYYEMPTGMKIGSTYNIIVKYL